MQSASAVFFDSGDVSSRTIALMRVKAVLRMLLMISNHQPVARHFGNNGSGGAGNYFAVPSDHGFLANR